MSITADDIARAAVDAAAAQLEAHGLGRELRHLDGLLSRAAREKANTVVLTIVTPSGDAGPHALAIAQAVEARVGRPVDVRQEADPAMLGGVTVVFGNERIDWSLRGALERLEDSLRSHPSPLHV
ncbi:MAG: hypothetical protein G01um101425_408 [Candidatus Peregrinibacteria bacterium Gr01-1014_25]|nr:MAG: hypothetical protein G01um101425_408 [Candidatus Peregrinibacteria bacterium Gr01-1014_25]